MLLKTLIVGTCLGLSGSMQVPLDIGYTGKGVLVGVYDTGFDFGHIQYRVPETGRSRISTAILYRDTEGRADSIREVYTEALQIDTLTTDTHASWHGTHTSGTAAGSYQGWGLQGVAPEASLMLCGTAKLERDRMEDALRSIFARADELDMPCVVNVSIGNSTGWKDGPSHIPLLCEELTDGGERPGRIIVFAAGNDGDKPFCLEHTFAESDKPVYTMLQAPVDKEGRPSYRNFGIEAYCSDSLPMQLSLVAYDTLAHQEVDYQLLTSRGDTISAWQLQSDTLYYTDSLAPDHGQRRYVCLDVQDTCQMLTAQPAHTVLAARFAGCAGSSFAAYYAMDSRVGTYPFSDAGQQGWLCSDSHLSISEFCCTESVISVGAYSNVDSLVNIFGNTLYPLAPAGHVAGFSSYGTTDYGVAKPDVLCPGVSVISGFSSFCDEKVSYYTSGRNPKSPIIYQLPPTEADDRWHYWAADVGTSMSAPAMAGIIALWLEANPLLTTNQVREILRQTSLFDSYCSECPIDPRQAGFGKVDALVGLEAVLALAGIEKATIDGDGDSVLKGIFDLYGRELDVPRSELPHGLYIIDGKKVSL